MLPLLINAETIFFGRKFNGTEALAIHFGIGIIGLIIGYLVFKNKKYSYYYAIILTIIMALMLIINRLII
ncbi:MAG: hypothetical protein J4F36_11290 [Nitrosopumilaceae archaeon]|nr:hypothetical protein [Nitrosopumilaceae archaeon]